MANEWVKAGQQVELETRSLQKKDTALNWATNNPVLLNGEYGIETDTRKQKVGDGVTEWNNLPYQIDQVFTKDEKDRLATVTENAEENQKAYSSVNLGGAAVNAASKTDQLKIDLDTNQFTSEVATDSDGNPTGLKLKLNDTFANDLAKLSGDNTFTGEVILKGDPVKDNEASTKKYVDMKVNDLLTAADVMQFKGIVNAASDLSNLTDYEVGWSYKVATAGTYAGQQCEIGDLIIATNSVSSADGGTYSDGDFLVVQTDIDGAITGSDTAGSVNDAEVAIYDGTSGRVIKSSGLTLGMSLPAAAKQQTDGSGSVTDNGDTDKVLTANADGTASWKAIPKYEISTDQEAGIVRSTTNDGTVDTVNTVQVNPTTGAMGVSTVDVASLVNLTGTTLILSAGDSNF